MNEKSRKEKEQNIPTVCNHDINDSRNTVLLTKRRIMTFPNEVRGVCQVCGRSLFYIKISKYILKREGEGGT